MEYARFRYDVDFRVIGRTGNTGPAVECGYDVDC